MTLLKVLDIARLLLIDILRSIINGFHKVEKLLKAAMVLQKFTADYINPSEDT